MTTEEKLQAILNAMPLNTEGIDNAMNEPYQFVDKLGITAVIHEIQDRIDAGGGGTVLPTPQVVFSINDTGDSGLMKLTLGYSEMGDVKVVMACNRAPELTDPEVTPSGTTVNQNGTWQIVAIQQDNTSPFISSLTAVVDVNSLKTQAPVISYDAKTYTVTMSCATTGATIRYTTDGTNPTSTSPVYSSAISITESKKFIAQAFKDGIQPSNMVSQQCNVARVWGVKWDTSQSSTALTRLTDETDPEGIVTEIITTEPKAANGASDNTASSPFDTDTPWAQMKMRNIAGTALGAWEDEDGFSLSAADVMVWLPKVWCLIKKVGAIWYYYISDNTLAGMIEHPGGGKYIARYFQGGGHISRSGDGANSATLTTHRQNAATLGGTGWHVCASQERSLVDLLYIIEYADWNSQQVIGYGNTSSSSNNGGTDSMVYHTGINGNTCQYRHIENLWGYYEWLDGILLQSGKIYICNDYTKFANSITSDYQEFGFSFTSTIGQGYITDFAYDEDNQWLMFIPSECSGGSDTTYVPDYGYLYYTSSVCAPYVGSNGGGSSSNGLFDIHVYNTPDGSNYASRLIYEEPSAA